MLRASSMMFGKASHGFGSQTSCEVRITKEIWVTLSHKAWWMHERCMSEADKSDFKELIEPFALYPRKDKETQVL